MNGVATPEEADYIRRLDAITDLDIGNIEDLLRLARLMISPMYDYERALAILRKLLSREPGNPWGVYWYAYCARYYLMSKEELRKAKAMIECWITAYKSESQPNEAVGALYEMLESIHHDLDLSASDRAILLEESVRLLPYWVTNRVFLAVAYLESCRYKEALHQLEVAKSYLIKRDADWDLLTEHYEQEITGRGSNYFAEKLAMVSQDMDAAELCKLFHVSISEACSRDQS